MDLKLSFDECLSPKLLEIAHEHDFLLSCCARDRGMLGKKDLEVAEYAAHYDFVLVTHNSKDFRGKGAERPGGIYANREVHCGLICINSVNTMDFDRQKRLFERALLEVASRGDMTNKALEIFEGENGQIKVQFYDIPKPRKQS
jgi:predicted nuclease of predicted toxin-antitoxin system